MWSWRLPIGVNVVTAKPETPSVNRSSSLFEGKFHRGLTMQRQQQRKIHVLQINLWFSVYFSLVDNNLMQQNSFVFYDSPLLHDQKVMNWLCQVFSGTQSGRSHVIKPIWMPWPLLCYSRLICTNSPISITDWQSPEFVDRVRNNDSSDSTKGYRAFWLTNPYFRYSAMIIKGLQY